MTPLLSLIHHKFQAEHVGAANAIRRAELRAWLRGQGVVTTDRKMRYAVKEIPGACCGPRGYYLAANIGEALACIAYLKKKIFPLWEDVKSIERAYPECGQMELPL